MFRCSRRQTLMLASVIFLLFLICIFKLSFTLESLAIKPSSSHSQDFLSHSDCQSKINTIINKHAHEIIMLQDQIRELQLALLNKKLRHHISANSSRIGESCLKQIRFTDKLMKTDAIEGQSYISERHVPIFTRFDMWHQYQVSSTQNMDVRDKLNGLQRMCIDEVIDEAVTFINSTKWRRDHFTEGIYHTMPTLGTHYELNFLNDSNHRERVTLFRPEMPVIPLKSHPVDFSEKLNIVMPLSGRIDTFVLFLTHFEEILIKMKNRIFLTIVYFGKSMQDLLNVFQPFIAKHRFRSHHIQLVTDRNFSRAYALDLGIKSWKGKQDPIVFLCDVDIIFSQEFVDRCMTYPQKKSRVYYPIVFSLYNPKVLEAYFNQKLTKLSDKLKVSSDYGLWRSFGFGMACIYRSDYLNIGGFDTGIKEWGEEDVLLYKKFAQSKITVIRAPDPNIFHLWHHKHCDQSLSDQHYKSCIKSKTYNEGSHMQLGYLVLKEDINQDRPYKRRLH